MKLLGLVGVVVCAAAAVFVWWTGSRLSQANEKVFERIDEALAASRDRVAAAQTRVQELKITTEDVRDSAENWVRKQATERLASRLEVEKKTEQLAVGLRQADQWLEVSGVSLQGVQNVLEFASSLGASADEASIEPLLERLGAARQRLKQSTETVDAIRERMAATAEGEDLGERIRHVAELAVRVFVTLGEVDSYLGQFADGLAARQTSGQGLKKQIGTYIVAAQVMAVLLIAWMAAGQLSLLRHGLRARNS